MVELLISLLIVILIFGVVWYVIRLIPLPPPFAVRNAVPLAA